MSSTVSKEVLTGAFASGGRRQLAAHEVGMSADGTPKKTCQIYTKAAVGKLALCIESIRRHSDDTVEVRRRALRRLELKCVV